MRSPRANKIPGLMCQSSNRIKTDMSLIRCQLSVMLPPRPGRRPPGRHSALGRLCLSECPPTLSPPHGSLCLKNTLAPRSGSQGPVSRSRCRLPPPPAPLTTLTPGPCVTGTNYVSLRLSAASHLPATFAASARVPIMALVHLSSSSSSCKALKEHVGGEPLLEAPPCISLQQTGSASGRTSPRFCRLPWLGISDPALSYKHLHYRGQVHSRCSINGEMEGNQNVQVTDLVWSLSLSTHRPV